MSAYLEEQITLESPVLRLTPDPGELKKVTLEIAQVDNSRQIQKFLRVYDNRVLGIAERSRRGEKQYLWNLLLLNENFTTGWNLKRGFLYSGIVLGVVAALVYLFQGELSALLPGHSSLLIMLLSGAGSMLLLFLTLKNLSRLTSFRTTHGDVPLLVLTHNAPDKASYRRFINQLVEMINAAKAGRKLHDTQFLSAELSEHRRLLELGVINQAQYETAKNSIFTKH